MEHYTQGSIRYPAFSNLYVNVGYPLSAQIFEKSQTRAHAGVISAYGSVFSFIISFTASSSIMRDICLKYKHFTTTNEFRVSVGTWNVNGGECPYFFSDKILCYNTYFDLLIR